jgi:rubredoxin
MNGWTCDGCGQAYDEDYGCGCTDRRAATLNSWGSLADLIRGVNG